MVDCRLKVKKKFEKWICRSNHQPIGNGYVYSIVGVILIFFGAGDCAWIRLAKFPQKWRWLFFFVVATRLSCKTRCTVTAKLHSCRFLVLKGIFKTWQQALQFLQSLETSRFIGKNVNTLFLSTCWTIHISNSLSYFVVHTQFFLSIFG